MTSLKIELTPMEEAQLKQAAVTYGLTLEEYSRIQVLGAVAGSLYWDQQESDIDWDDI